MFQRKENILEKICIHTERKYVYQLQAYSLPRGKRHFSLIVQLMLSIIQSPIRMLLFFKLYWLTDLGLMCSHWP